MLRAMLYQDSITNRAARFIDELRAERGDLAVTTAPIGLVVVDVLRAIGLPDNALSIVLGDDPELTTDTIGQTVTAENAAACACCGQPATHLVQGRSGVFFACAVCAAESGLEVVR